MEICFVEENFATIFGVMQEILANENRTQKIANLHF